MAIDDLIENLNLLKNDIGNNPKDLQLLLALLEGSAPDALLLLDHLRPMQLVAQVAHVLVHLDPQAPRQSGHRPARRVPCTRPVSDMTYRCNGPRALHAVKTNRACPARGFIRIGRRRRHVFGTCDGPRARHAACRPRA